MQYNGMVARRGIGVPDAEDVAAGRDPSDVQFLKITYPLSDCRAAGCD